MVHIIGHSRKLQFFAYSPEAGGITNYATTGTYPSFTYTLQTIQTDLLAACVTDKAKPIVQPLLEV